MDTEEISNFSDPVITEVVEEENCDSHFEDLPPIAVSFSASKVLYQDLVIPGDKTSKKITDICNNNMFDTKH